MQRTGLIRDLTGSGKTRQRTYLNRVGRLFLEQSTLQRMNLNLSIRHKHAARQREPQSKDHDDGGLTRR